MSKTTSVYTRVEPEIKSEAELVLSQLGIPMSSAINIFLRQIIIQRGLPFEVKLNDRKIVNVSQLSDEEFHYELSKGCKDIEEGRLVDELSVAEALNRKYLDGL